MTVFGATLLLTIATMAGCSCISPGSCGDFPCRNCGDSICNEGRLCVSRPCGFSGGEAGLDGGCVDSGALGVMPRLTCEPRPAACPHVRQPSESCAQAVCGALGAEMNDGFHITCTVR